MSTSTIPIDVAMPTLESEPVLDGTLAALARAESNAPVTVDRLLIEDAESPDDTVDIARERCERHGWAPAINVVPSSLPKDRERLVERVDTEWFLFLDDDARIQTDYLSRQVDAIAPAVGAVQGRKASRTEHPSDWVHRRSRRGGTHATLIRTNAVHGIEIPAGLTMVHDEYIRQFIEARGYCWVFQHQARYEHENQGRHPVGWREGYEQGHYQLGNFVDLALNVPYSALTRRNPVPHALRAAGWLYGTWAPGGGRPTPTTADARPAPEVMAGDD